MSFSPNSHSVQRNRAARPASRLGLGAVCVLGAIAGTLLAASSAQALVYTYNNTTAGAIPEVASDALCNGGTALVRTFTVSDSFTVATIALGFNASHVNRGEIRAILNAPGGTSQVFIAQAADTLDNYDILISTNSEGALNDTDADPTAAPFFNRLVSLAGANFYTGNSAGTWTLRVCDRTGGGTTGTFNRAYLMLGSAVAVTSVCTSRVAYDWGLLGGTGVNPTPLAGNPVTIGGLTITQTSTTDFAGTASGAFTMRNTTNGNHPGYYSLVMDASIVGGTQDNEAVGLVSVIGFSVPIRDLSFDLLDVDITGGSWEDQIELIGTDASGNRVPYTIAPVAGGNAQLAGDLAEGDASAANAATTGNLAVAFAGAVSSLTLNYTQGSDPGNENNQMVIGLTDFNECAFDFGDAPNTYGTQLAGGARHVLGNRDLWLGANRPDGEGDGATGGGVATADDAAALGGVDDEDGITVAFPTCPGTGAYSVNISASDVRTAGADGAIRGYIDWNRDGDFADANEISAATTVPRANADPLNYAITWSGVPTACGGSTSTFARFRFSTDTAAIASPTGQASDGEVEDYQISAATLPVTLAWVESVPAGESLVVRFATATETGNAGFRIWGTNPGGKTFLLGDVKSQVIDSFSPRSYEVAVNGAGVSAIQIEDVSIYGKNRLHGPFAVGTSAGELPQVERVDWAEIRQATGLVSDLDRVRAAEGPGAAERVAELNSSLFAATSALVLVREAGIHRLTYEDLIAAGVDLAGVEPGRIALVDGGQGIPRHVETAGKRFGPGSFLEFVARPQLTLASPVDAYELRLDPALAIAVQAGSYPGRGQGGVTAATAVHRPDHIYGYASPSADPWYDGEALAWGAPATLRRSFELPDLAVGPVNLKVRLWGIGDLAGAAPDHHVVVRLNGTEIGQSRFDGFSVWEPEFDVTGLVEPAGNELEIFLPWDTGYSFDYIALEGFEATYSRATHAENGRFMGSVPNRRSFAVTGFAEGEPVVIWKVSGGAPSRYAARAEAGSVFAPGGQGEVLAAAQSGLLRPGVSAGLPLAKASAAPETEYLIVTHPVFASGLTGLVNLEESRGLTTEVVAVDRIFAAYSDHAASPAALKSFLSASLAHGRMRYVLLVGADTTDPHDHLGTGSVSFVPTDYLDFTQVVNYSPTDESLVDRDADGVGDVPIGRLPVRTQAELDAVVEKLVAWEQRVGQGQPSALLAAGASDSTRWLAQINEAYAAELVGWQTNLAQVDDSSANAVRQRLLAAVNSGTKLVSYVGHSSMGQWDFTPILKWQDAAGLGNHLAPNLFTAWGCWNSYYVEPTIESLSARMLRELGVGAAGMIGATTLTTESSHRELGRLFFARLNAGATTVGEAFHGAKQDLHRQGGGATDAIYGMTLLGDPAMSLPRP